ncbi:hypothetical protein ACFYZE_24225 [Streptomyces sp. NPDC001796]|uniref:hypothetical protein n=1 Tax=Streptomyces sp. NPDC001796 TaxID=3364609 RepID=UPI0036B84925
MPQGRLRVGIADGRVETLVQDAGSAPDGIVIEAGVVYWTTMGTPTHDPAEGSGEAAQDFSRRNGGVHAVRGPSLGRARTPDTGQQRQKPTAPELVRAVGFFCPAGQQGR